MPARILVVDDEPDVEPLLTQRFRRRVRAGEFDLVFEADGEAALNRLSADPAFDVVLSDINMPRMDGLTLLGPL
jgi:CheY-like chemotaxis protein